MKAKGTSLLCYYILHRQQLIYTSSSSSTIFFCQNCSGHLMFLKGGQLVVTCQSPFIYSVYTNITLQSAMQALHCVRQKKIGRHRATMSGGWHGTTPAIACQEGLLGHNIITKEELHAHNTFSNGNQVISNVSNGHENSRSNFIMARYITLPREEF